MPLFRRPVSFLGKGRSKKRRELNQMGAGHSSSLVHLCLVSLAENMKEFWTRDYTENYMDQYSFRYIMGPFDMLPGDLVEDLLALLASRRLLTRAALHLLLVPQLRGLSLSSCSGVVTPNICQLIGIRCQALRSLDLSGSQNLSALVLSELLGCVPSLRALCLAGTVCDGRVLRTVGSRCPALQHLDVSRCPHLGPASLLLVAYLPSGRTGPPLQTLLALDTGFGETETDKVGGAAFLLLALPTLTNVALEGLGDACALIEAGDFGGLDVFTSRERVPSLSEMWDVRFRGDFADDKGARKGGVEEGYSDEEEMEGWPSEEESDSETEVEQGKKGNGKHEVGRVPQSKATAEMGRLQVKERGTGERERDSERAVTLRLRAVQGVSCETLGAVRRLCPELSSLSMTCELDVVDRLAASLGLWVGQLLSLSLQFTGPLSEILPALKAVGATLRSLSLEGVKVDSIASFLRLVHLCPELKTLLIHAEPPNISQEEDDEEQGPQNLPCLAELRCLTLKFSLELHQKRPLMSWKSLRWAMLSLLGGSPLLEKATLVAVPCPVDDIIPKILEHRPRTPGASKSSALYHLRHLCLANCNVSKETVTLLMTRVSDLSTLDLSRCWNLSWTDIGILQKKATRRRQPLTIIWT